MPVSSDLGWPLTWLDCLKYTHSTQLLRRFTWTTSFFKEFKNSSSILATFIDFDCKIQMSAFSTFMAANKITNSLSCCQCFFYSTFFTEGVVLINPKSFDDHLIIIIISSFWPNLQFKTYLTMTSQYFWKHIIKNFSNDDLDVSNTSAITTLKSEAGSKGLASQLLG